MKRNNRPRWRMALLFVAFIVSAAVLGTLMLRKYEKSHHISPVPPQPRQTGALLVTLFFASPDGEGLMREGREIDACSGPEECVEAVLDELINGPLGELAPTLPPSTTVREVRVSGEEALIDLNKGFEEGLPGGSSSEMTALYSIVDTVAINFPQLKKVRFLIEGKTVDTLKGHLDLRQPLVPDFTLEKGLEPVPGKQSK